MAGFVSRLVACLVAVVAVLQLVHLVLLNKLESTRLHELRRLQQQQQYHHLQIHGQQDGDQRQFDETGSLQPGNPQNQSPEHSVKSARGYGSSSNPHHSPDQQWGNWRPARSAASGIGGGGGAASADVPEQEIRFDHLLREDQGAIMDSTGEFRIVFDVAGPRSSSQFGMLQQGLSMTVIEKDAIIPGTNAQTDDFSIDDENFEGIAPPVDVTLVTFGDFHDSMQSLIPLVSRWNGPMSVAIFSQTAAEMQQVLEFISHARLCHGPTREFVSFHLVFPLAETHSHKGASSSHNKNNESSSNGPSRYEKWKNSRKATQSQSQQQQHQNKRLNQSSTSGSSNNNNKTPIDLIGNSCQSFRDHINKYSQSRSESSGGGKKRGNANDRQQHVFPVNLLRNVARKRVATEYSFVINMDLFPSRDLRSSFQQFARDRLVGSGDEKKTVFVVPAFEIKSEEQIPFHKAELLTLIDKHRARPFQFDLCWKCQMYTDYETWQRDQNKNGKLGILFEVLWKDPWEPFYISYNTAPLFDERFTHNGVTRTSQLCELHVAGYKFAVLNEAFLVKRGYSLAPRNQQEDKNRDVDSIRAHFRQFKIELKDKYPHSTRRCY